LTAACGRVNNVNIVDNINVQSRPVFCDYLNKSMLNVGAK
jgi:hypothetical protein